MALAPKAFLVFGAISGNHLHIDCGLFRNGVADEKVGEGTVDVGDGALHSLAIVATAVAVAQFESFMCTR